MFNKRIEWKSAAIVCVYRKNYLCIWTLSPSLRSMNRPDKASKMHNSSSVNFRVRMIRVVISNFLRLEFERKRDRFDHTESFSSLVCLFREVTCSGVWFLPKLANFSFEKSKISRYRMTIRILVMHSAQISYIFSSRAIEKILPSAGFIGKTKISTEVIQTQRHERTNETQ